MKKYLTGAVMTAVFFATGAVALADTSKPITVGGQMMYSSKDIIDNAAKSADHTTLVAAIKAAGLVDTLKGPGPFTVFAPTNQAFANLPAGTVETLLKPENKATLTKILTYHVVSGRLDFNAIAEAIQSGGGKAVVKTVSGGTLTATMNGPHNLLVTDEKGNVAHVTTYDVNQSNGVIHVVDKVLMPRSRIVLDKKEVNDERNPHLARPGH